MGSVSVVVLVESNTEYLSPLVDQINTTCAAKNVAYEIIFVSSASNKTIETCVEDTYASLPLRYYTFEDATPDQLLSDAAGLAMYDTIGFVRSDQVASVNAAITALLHDSDKEPGLVVAKSRYTTGRNTRHFIGATISHLYGTLPMQMRYSAVEGMVLIKKELLTGVRFSAAGPLITPDFLTRIRTTRMKIVGYIAQSDERRTKRKNKKPGVLTSAFLIAWQKLAPERYEEFDTAYQILHGSGFRYRGHEYITHNKLPRKNTAVERTTLYQRIVMICLLCIVIAGAFIEARVLLVVIVSLVTILYFFDLLFNMFLIYRSLKRYSEIKVTEKELRQKRSWPSYTILCPLYKEALVVPQFIGAMQKIDYPKKSLKVLLLLESNDTETITAIRSMNLPHFFTIVVVPHSLPKTKPKACNYGLLQATGEYCVIYDAEDIPDPLQLKKAVIAFERAPLSTACVQAKLNYYNWNQNLLTRLFTLEYSLWFNLILTGLQSIKAPIPLGGTSNHFRTAVLRDLGGWDPFNVTEDADLGIRLSKRGLTTVILDSTTYEEANSALGNWLRQRSRWIKGYIQTYLVHMRDLRELGKNGHRVDMLTFQLVIGGKIVSMLVNPTLWVMTVGYFVLRNEIGGYIESLYLTPIFYIGAFALIVGNFLYLYYYMIGALRQGRPELAVFTAFVPLYWLMMSVAAGLAMYDLIVRPFHWHKTKHGLHLKKAKESVS